MRKTGAGLVVLLILVLVLVAGAAQAVPLRESPPPYLDAAKPPHAAVKVGTVWKESTDPDNPVIVPVQSILTFQVREYDPSLQNPVGELVNDQDTWNDPTPYWDLIVSEWDFNGEFYSAWDNQYYAEAMYSFSPDSPGLKAINWKMRDRFAVREANGFTVYPDANDDGILGEDDPDYGVWDTRGTLYVAAVDPNDTTPPSVLFVTDDGAQTSSTATLHATWGAKDAESGIKGYSYAIGTSPGAADVADWTDVGRSTGATKTGLSLIPGTTYYFTVKAKNWLGLEGTASSDGITVVANTPPAQSNFVSYTYDKAGNRDSMTDWRGTARYGYDVMGRLTAATEPNGRVITYEYDINGSKTAMNECIDPSHNFTTRYVYNKRGQIKRVVDKNGGLTTFSYYDNGLPDTVSLPNGTQEKYQFNHDLLVTKSNIKPDGTVIARFDYEYAYNPAQGKWGRDGSVTAVTEQVLRPDNLSYINSRTDISRFDLTSSEVRTGDEPYSRTYTYDPIINRLTRDEAGNPPVTRAYQFDDMFRLASGGDTTLSYDIRGNVDEDLTSGVLTRYYYDFLGRVSSVERNGITEAAFYYDGNNGVVRRDIDGVTYNYTIDPITGATLSEESGGQFTLYSHDDSGGLISSVDASEIIFYHFGSDGNVYALTKDSTQVTGSASYDLSGHNLAVLGGMLQQPWRLGGMFGLYTLHQSSGLHLVQVGGSSYVVTEYIEYWVTTEPVPHHRYGSGGYRLTFQTPIHIYELFNSSRCSEPIDWWKVGENVGTFLVGMGDALTFNGTRLIRKEYAGEYDVDTESGWYVAGEIASIPVDLGLGTGLYRWGARTATLGYRYYTGVYRISPWRWEVHHLLPRSFLRRFAPLLEDAGLTIDDFTVNLRRWKHVLSDYSIHAGPYANSWNGRWARWLSEHPNATLDEVLEFLAQLKREFGI